MLFLIKKDNTIYGVYNNYTIMVENMKYLKIKDFKILKFNINMISYDIVKQFSNNNYNNNKIFILKDDIDYIGIYDSLEKTKKIISFLDKLQVNKTYEIYYTYINSISVSKYVEKKKIILTDDIKKELAEKEKKLRLEKYELNKELNELKMKKKK